jgi:hypothetical protein
MTKLALSILLVLASAAPAFAQEAAHPACASVSDAALPPALAGWRERSALAAAAGGADTGRAVLPIGKGVDAQLKHVGEVTYPVLPGKPGGSVSYGGLYEVRVSEPGDYQVSLGTGAWIEVLDGNTLIESTAHAPGPACTTLRKTVVFPLKAGRYVLEITGNGEPSLPVMVSRVGK